MILPNWKSPSNINAFTVTRADPALTPAPRFLKQVHGKTVVTYPSSAQDPLEADAVITRTPNTLCIIRTADCLPILVTNQKGSEIAAIHAGWKGLVAGVIEETFSQFKSNPNECIVWIGPAICQNCFETGPEVCEAFIGKYPKFATSFIKAENPNKFLGDLPKIANFILQTLGVQEITLSGICTVEDLRCNSYRREKGTDQRMMTGISFT